jgi:hypothetical protein
MNERIPVRGSRIEIRFTVADYIIKETAIEFTQNLNFLPLLLRA